MAANIVKRFEVYHLRQLPRRFNLFLHRNLQFDHGEFCYSVVNSNGRFVLGRNKSCYLCRDEVIDYIISHRSCKYKVLHFVMYWDGMYGLVSIMTHIPIKFEQLCLFSS